MQIHSQSAGRGMDWISGGFGLFRQNPLIWIVIGIVYLVVATLVSLIPAIGAAAMNLITPVLGAGLMAGCEELEQGGELRIEHLFEGFKQRTQPLLLVGLLTLAGSFVIALIGIGAFLMFGGAAVGLGMFVEGQAPNFGMDGEGALPLIGAGLIAVLLALSLMVPLAMATWFAPALVWFRGLPALEAMKQSFIGCWRNMLPFLIYGLAAGVLIVLASIPFGLGLLVLGPTLVGSIFVAYRDIFAETP